MTSEPKIPPGFKAILPYIRRAEELDKDVTRPESKLIAYFCRQYAMELGIKLRENDTSPEATEFLLSLMDKLEREKNDLPSFTQNEGKEICEDFALEVFFKADDEDRRGNADKNTARTFYAAGTFLDILNQFGEVSDDILEKRKYCKFKAANILKAIKEARVPEAGPPSVQDGDVNLKTEQQEESKYDAISTSIERSWHCITKVAPHQPLPMENATPSVLHEILPIQGPSSYQPVGLAARMAPPTPVPIGIIEDSSQIIRQGSVTQNNINDAIECAKFAVAALKVKDIDLAIRRLEMALKAIR